MPSDSYASATPIVIAVEGATFTQPAIVMNGFTDEPGENKIGIGDPVTMHRSAWWSYTPAVTGRAVFDSDALSDPAGVEPATGKYKLTATGIYRARADGAIPTSADQVVTVNTPWRGEIAVQAGVTYLIQGVAIGPDNDKNDTIPDVFWNFPVSADSPQHYGFTLTGPTSAPVVPPARDSPPLRLKITDRQWDLIPLDGPDLPRGLLRLNLGGRWHRHIDRRLPDAAPLKLRTPKGWATVAWLGSSQGPIVLWKSEALLPVPLNVTDAHIFALDTFAPFDGVTTSLASRTDTYASPWLGFAERGRFDLSDFGDSHDQPRGWSSYTIGYTTVDLNLVRRYLPPGTNVTGAVIQFTVDLQGYVPAAERDGFEFPFGMFLAELLDVTGEVEVTHLMIAETSFQRVDVGTITVNSPGVTLVVDGGPTEGHTRVGQWSFGEVGPWRDGTAWPTVKGTVTCERSIDAVEFGAVDHLDFALKVDNPLDPPVWAPANLGEVTGSRYTRNLSATGRWELIVFGDLPDGL